VIMFVFNLALAVVLPFYIGCHVTRHVLLRYGQILRGPDPQAVGQRQVVYNHRVACCTRFLIVDLFHPSIRYFVPSLGITCHVMIYPNHTRMLSILTKVKIYCSL
jgi:hypothetical protein